MTLALVGLAALLLTAPPSPPAGPTPEPSPSASPSETPSPPENPAPAASPSPGVPTEYLVGAGDVLDVFVFGNEDLSRASTVQPNGSITIPLLGEVPVAGLSLPEIKVKLTALLARDYLVNPQVEVKVREYQSQFVIVLGEVNSPGRKPLRGRTRLIDVLVEAGGFTTRASGEIEITRADGTFEGGSRTLKLRFAFTALTPQAQGNLELPLRNGDIISASPKYYVTVEGEVTRPGRYLLEGDLTVSGAISTAGGMTRYGSSGVKVRRIDGQTGTVRVIEVDLGAVRDGKDKDLPLQPNDVVSVSRRFF